MDAHAASTLDFGDGSLREDDDDDIRSGRSESSRAAIARSHGYGDVRARPRARPEGAVGRLLRFFRKQSDRGYRELRDRVPDSAADRQHHHNHHNHNHHPHHHQQFPAFQDDDDLPPTTCMGSFRQMMLSSWLNALLVFVPIGMMTYLTHMNPIAVFTSNAIAVIPLSSLLTAATEKVASDAGDTVGALLNISLGNLVELILFVALVNNHIRVVQASILGSILVNSMLILGTALLATGLSDNEPIYNTAETQLLSSLLFASVFVFLMPTAFGYTFDHTKVSKATLKMSRVSSLMVLLIYLLYFVHELKARPVRNTAEPGPSEYDVESDGGGIQMSMTELRPPVVVTNAHGINSLPARTIRFADESYETMATAPSTTTTTTATAITTTAAMSPARDAANNKAVPPPLPSNTIDVGHPDIEAATDAATGSYEGDLGIDGRGRRNESAVYTSGRPHMFMPRSRSRTNSHTRPPSALRSQIQAQAQLQSQPQSIPAEPVYNRPSRASSISAVSGASGMSAAYSMSGAAAPGVPGHAGMAGFNALGGPGLMRSGLAALQIMRDTRPSLDSSDARPVPVRQPRPPGEFMMAVLVLMVASGLMSVNAEFLVDTIDAVTHQGHLSESVIGLIILPIVGNIAEYVTVVSVAMRDKLDLAISVAIGSSIQIALCVTPLTVGAGWILNRNLSLTFSFFEMAALVGSALLVGLLVSSDGDRKLRTCGLKGALMCACYVIIAFGAYLSPNV